MAFTKIEKIARQAIKAKTNKHNIGVSELAISLVREFGDIAGLAAQIHREYEESKPGSLARSRLLVSVVDVIKSTEKLMKGDDELSMLSVQDIEAMLKATIGKGTKDEQQEKQRPVEDGEGAGDREGTVDS